MDAPDPSEVAAALGLPAVLEARRMAGYDAVVWRCRLADDRTVALRVLRRGLSADRDLAALELARRHGQPSPRVVASGGVGGRAAVVTTWLPGRPIADALLAGDPRPLGVPFGRAQAELHHPVDGQVLCHLDYHPFNVLVDGPEDDVTVSGIVDWTNARVGDAREDVATTQVVLELAPVVQPRLATTIDAFRDQWRAGYSSLRPFPDLPELAPFLDAAAARQAGDWARREHASAGSARIAASARELARRRSTGPA